MSTGNDPWWEKIVAGVVLWVLGLISRDIIEPLSIRIGGPKLHLRVEDILTPGHATDVDGSFVGVEVPLYVRIKVTNLKRRLARNCQAFLTKVEEWDSAERHFKPPFLQEAIPLIWSYDRGLKSVDIPKGIVRHVDVLEIRKGIEGVSLQLWTSDNILHTILRFEHYFKRYGLYRYTVMLGADEISPTTITFRVRCDGNWPPAILEG